MSQNLLTKLNIRRNYKAQGWKFDGTVDENNLKIFCREENIVFEDFVKVSASFQLMREYSELFDAWNSG